MAKKVRRRGVTSITKKRKTARKSRRKSSVDLSYRATGERPVSKRIRNGWPL